MAQPSYSPDPALLAIHAALAAVYREGKHLAGLFLNSGWRPMIGFAGVFLCWGVAFRIANGLPLPGVAEILGAIVPTMGIACLRTFEKFHGVASSLGFGMGPAGAPAMGPGADADHS